MVSPSPHEIFDRARRRTAYRGLTSQAETPLFHNMVADDLVERLTMVTRRFDRALIINPVDHAIQGYLENARTLVDTASIAEGDFEEDRPSLPQSFYDLILVPWGLESINDLPGALSLFRMAMKPDSLLLASFPGGGSFITVRDSIREAEMETLGLMEARFHPQIDVRAMGDLLQRTGFHLPVIDVDVHNLHYSSLAAATDDLRNHGWGNALAERAMPLNSDVTRLAEEKFLGRNDGQEALNLITVTAWTAGENQPQPAKRGSGMQSLTRVLKGKDTISD